MADGPFYASMAAIFCLVVPFWYYSYSCFVWNIENAPEGYDVLRLDEFRFTLYGAVFYFCQDKVIHFLFFTTMRDKWCKE